MKLISLLPGVSHIVQWASSLAGVMNYNNFPLRSPYKLKKINETLNQNLNQAFCTCLIIHLSNNPIVTPNSVKVLPNSLINTYISISEIESDRHHLLNENTEKTHQWSLNFVEKLSTSLEEPTSNIKEIQP